METSLPSLFAVAAAALFGVNVHIQRRALDDTNPVLGALLSVFAMAVMFWLAAPFALDPAWLGTKTALIFLGVGIFFPALGQSLQVASVPKVGPALTAAIGAFTPFFAVFVGLWLLSEYPSPSDYLGISLMTFALILATRKNSGVPRSFPVWVLLLPLGAALARGLGQPISRFALQDIPSPYFATLMASTMATFVLAMNWIAFGRGKRVGKRGVTIFLFSGIVNGLGILCVHSALRLGEVSLVSPLVSTSPLWAILFGLVVFRRETLGKRHVFIAALVFVGSVLILN